jgi:hypothetical protein
VIRSELRKLPGPEVASSFLDLGVAQTPVNRPSPLQGKRVDSGLSKLWRTSVLSLSLKRRCHFVAASGIPASLYGVASAPLSNRTLQSLVTAALAAIWRSTARCASELVFELFVPRRADPTAVSVLAPWLALRAALLAGTLPGENLQSIWDFPHAAGPVRACKDALRRSGTTFSAGTLTLCLHGTSFPLLASPASTIKDCLMRGLSSYRLQKLALRRPVFAFLRGGFDRVSTDAYGTTSAPESRKAALRVVQTGGTITQSVATRWVPGGSLCPFCRFGKEDPYHRFWVCPRWHAIRASSLGAHSRSSLEATLGRPSLTTGVFPPDQSLVDAQALAESVGSWPPPIPLPGEVWTDGSCTHPQDPLLRRAAWAVVGGPPGYPTLGASMVIGRQTIGRAELSALVWVSMCGGASAIIDAQYLIGCMARCAGGLPPAALLDSANGDLWRLLLRPFPVRWVRAHLTTAQAVEAGVSERDRLGNDAADIACSRLATNSNPGPHLISARATHLEAALVVQTVLATIQEAALTAHHAPGSTIAKRKWKRRRPALLVPRKAPRPRPPPLALVAPAGPTAIHSIAIERGPLSASLFGPHVISWRIACTNCTRSALGTGRWAAFARSVCGSFPGVVHYVRTSAPHDMCPAVHGWVCLRCRLPVAAGRRASAAQATCPVPEVLRADGQVCLQSRLQLQINRATIIAWHTARRVVPQVVPAPSAPPSRLLRWLEHWCLRYGRTEVCLRCGKSAAVNSLTPLRSTSCPGLIDPPSTALTIPLRAGSLDEALSSSPCSWTERAILLGWQAIGRGGFPPAYLVPSRGGAHGGPEVASMPPD